MISTSLSESTAQWKAFTAAIPTCYSTAVASAHVRITFGTRSTQMQLMGAWICDSFYWLEFRVQLAFRGCATVLQLCLFWLGPPDLGSSLRQFLLSKSTFCLQRIKLVTSPCSERTSGQEQVWQIRIRILWTAVTVVLAEPAPDISQATFTPVPYRSSGSPIDERLDNDV